MQLNRTKKKTWKAGGDWKNQAVQTFPFHLGKYFIELGKIKERLKKKQKQKTKTKPTTILPQIGCML